jgi:nucleotide-binding universal stress UspA family protein
VKILLATDGSEFSEEAAKFLTGFRFTQRDEIVVLHVVSEIPYEDDHYANIKRFFKKVAPQILDSSVDVLKPLKAKVSVVEEEGDPDATIIDQAVQYDVDLIVMGARGVKGVKRLFLGSSTRSVVSNSPKPVLVVKHSLREPHDGMKILFAADGSDSAQETAGLLSSLPFPDNSELTILHVAWSSVSDIPERFAMEINDKMKEDVAKVRAVEFSESGEILDGAKKFLSGRFSNVRAFTKMGDPSIEILNEAEVFQSDIIAVGSRGLKGVKGMMGSVSRRILGHSSCSVLIGKMHSHDQ